jgi:hypothetical protein
MDRQKLYNGLMIRSFGKIFEFIIDLKTNKITMETIYDLFPRNSDKIQPIIKGKDISNKILTLDLECYGPKKENETKL